MIPVQPDFGTHTDRTHGGTRKPVQPGVLGTPCAGTFGSLPVQPSDLGTPTSWTYGSAEKPVQPGVSGTPCAWTFGSLPVQPSDLGTPTPWTHGIVEEIIYKHSSINFQFQIGTVWHVHPLSVITSSYTITFTGSSPSISSIQMDSWPPANRAPSHSPLPTVRVSHLLSYQLVAKEVNPMQTS